MVILRNHNFCSIIMNTIHFSLLLSLGFCHFLADYPLSTANMLAAKSKGTPLFPIFKHALVHACLMTFVCFLFAAKNPLTLFILQLSTHFVVDVLKGKLNVWFPTVQNPKTKMHWFIFGMDQYLHFAVIATMVHIFR